MKSSPRPKGREAIKAWNRQKIIDATIDVITSHSIAGTTIARVVKLADVSMGLVNVHFKSKDALLREVLVQMADDYNQNLGDALAAAPQGPGGKISALVQADLDEAVLNVRTLGVWFAFRAQARANPEYVDLTGTRDREQLSIAVSQFEELNRESGLNHPPALAARGLIAMLEGMWSDFFLYPDTFDRQGAIDTVFLYLDTLYPGFFGAATGE